MSMQPTTSERQRGRVDPRDHRALGLGVTHLDTAESTARSTTVGGPAIAAGARGRWRPFVRLAPARPSVLDSSPANIARDRGSLKRPAPTTSTVHQHRVDQARIEDTVGRSPVGRGKVGMSPVEAGPSTFSPAVRPVTALQTRVLLWTRDRVNPPLSELRSTSYASPLGTASSLARSTPERTRRWRLALTNPRARRRELHQPAHRRQSPPATRQGTGQVAGLAVAQGTTSLRFRHKRGASRKAPPRTNSSCCRADLATEQPQPAAKNGTEGTWSHRRWADRFRQPLQPSASTMNALPWRERRS